MKSSKNFGLSPDLLDAVRNVLAGKPKEESVEEGGPYPYSARPGARKTAALAKKPAVPMAKWIDGSGKKSNPKPVKEEDEVKTEEIKKGSYVTNKKGHVGKVHGVSGDKSSVDIKWNKGGGSSLPMKHVTKIKEDDDEVNEDFSVEVPKQKIGGKTYGGGATVIVKAKTASQAIKMVAKRLGVDANLLKTGKLVKEEDDDELDDVDPKAVKKKFKDRKDKDIDNDGDTDDSDKFLHKKRKAISKAVAKDDEDDDDDVDEGAISTAKSPEEKRRARELRTKIGQHHADTAKGQRAQKVGTHWKDTKNKERAKMGLPPIHEDEVKLDEVSAADAAVAGAVMKLGSRYLTKKGRAAGAQKKADKATAKASAQQAKHDAADASRAEKERRAKEVARGGKPGVEKLGKPGTDAGSAKARKSLGTARTDHIKKYGTSLAPSTKRTKMKAAGKPVPSLPSKTQKKSLNPLSKRKFGVGYHTAENDPSMESFKSFTNRVELDELRGTAGASLKDVQALDKKHAAYKTQAKKDQKRVDAYTKSNRAAGMEEVEVDESPFAGKGHWDKMKFPTPAVKVVEPPSKKKKDAKEDVKPLARQLKDKKKEMMVHHPKTGVKVIDKKDWNMHKAGGYTQAEEVEHNEDHKKEIKKGKKDIIDVEPKIDEAKASRPQDNQKGETKPIKQGTPKAHDCAKKVVHEDWGRGACLPQMHAEPDEEGNVAWYDVIFEHGIEKEINVDDLEIIISEGHTH